MSTLEATIMDDQLFDDFTRDIARTTSKRGILRLLFGGAFLAVTKSKSTPRAPRAETMTGPVNVSIGG